MLFILKTHKQAFYNIFEKYFTKIIKVKKKKTNGLHVLEDLCELQKDWLHINSPREQLGKSDYCNGVFEKQAGFMILTPNYCTWSKGHYKKWVVLLFSPLTLKSSQPLIFIKSREVRCVHRSLTFASSAAVTLLHLDGGFTVLGGSR